MPSFHWHSVGCGVVGPQSGANVVVGARTYGRGPKSAEDGSGSLRRLCTGACKDLRGRKRLDVGRSGLQSPELW